MAQLSRRAAVFLLAGSLACSGPLRANAQGGHWREASLGEYRTHLQVLSGLVADCAKGRDLKSCDPTQVGQDDLVPVGNTAGAEHRLMRFGWLRVLLSKAEDKDEAGPEAKSSGAKASPETAIRPPRRTTSELLKDAEARLTQDLAQADAAATAAAAPGHAAERETMRQVLTGREFRNLEAPNARDSALEKLGTWLNRLMESVAKLQARSAWLGRVVVWGFVVAVCVGLLWGLLQLERRWRVRLVPVADGPAEGAASARDWQLWLADAREAAAQGQWREAIHFVYWASISRLESKRLWPADRARTPREYLALVAGEDPRRPGLARLTGSFERTWYGGRAAGEADYQSAEEVAAGLIQGVGAGPAEGGVR